MSMSTTTIVVGLAENTVVNWFNFLREECSAKLLRMPMQDKLIGGVGEIVEVDNRLWSRGNTTVASFENSMTNGFSACTIVGEKWVGLNLWIGEMHPHYCLSYSDMYVRAP